MCFFGGDNTASDIAAQNRADQQARQARITSGMADINNVFDGQKSGSGVATSYDPSKTYYMADGTQYAPYKAGTSGGPFNGAPGTIGGILEGVFNGLGGRTGTPTAASGVEGDPNQLAKEGKLFTGVTSTGGFNDDFYNKQKQAYIDYAQPQADHQAGLAKDQMVYALSRSGLLDSMAGQKENSEFGLAQDQNRIDINNQAQNVENDARSRVENARGNLVSELNATGDDAAAAAGAVRQSQTLYQPVGYSPLGNMFSTFTQGLSNIGSNAQNNYSGLISQLPALFGGGGGGSSRVVRTG